LDDINGCWANVEDVDTCSKLNDEGYYPFFDEEDDELDDYQDDITCGCKECICPNTVEFEGEVCHECLTHNHQG
jgi:hypothetical protein